MFNIVEKRKIWFTISSIFVIASVLSLSLWGLSLGIDFTGGTIIEYRSSASIGEEEIKDAFDKTHQTFPKTCFILRYPKASFLSHLTFRLWLDDI